MNQRVLNPLPVGAILALELDARGWTQSDFATVLDRPVQFVSEIVNGKKEITRESAAQIGAALGQDPEYWLNLQDQYLLDQQANNTHTQNELTEVRRRARLNMLVPIALLRKRGVLVATTLDDLEAEVIELLELDTIDDQPTFKVAARRSNHDERPTPLQQAWVGCIRRRARAGITDLSPYSLPKFLELAALLPELLSEPAAFKELPELFAACGVVLVYVEALPGAKIDGCAFTLDGTPVIAISGRGKRLDKVLWTLLHEVAHVALGHLTDAVIVETLDDHGDNASGNEEDGEEVAANNEARTWLLPQPLPQAGSRVSSGWVQTVAAGRGLAPIVIVGQLQHQGVLDWRTTLARNAPTVTKHLEAW